MPNYLVVGTAGTPVPLLPSGRTALMCRKANVLACKTLAGPTASPNTGLVYIGRSPNADEQPFELSSGSERSLDAPAGGRMEMAHLYLKVATSGDGVIVDYE